MATAFGLSDLREESGFFDFIICPVMSLEGLLNDFPAFVGWDELSVVRDNALWLTKNIFFVHSFRKDGVPSGPLDFSNQLFTSISKINYLRSKFLSLESVSDRFIFVMGNTQSDLITHFHHSDDLIERFAFIKARIGRIRDQLSARFDARFLALIVVENNVTRRGEWELDQVIRCNLGDPDDHWTGDSGAWLRALTDAMKIIL